MWMLNFSIFVATLKLTAGDFSAPGCAIRCWENTKYVSKCLGDDVCLCRQPEYQTQLLMLLGQSILQCLYSQCDTAHFGTALHHTISQCSSVGDEILFAMHLLPHHDTLRRHEAEYIAGAKILGSGSAIGFPTQSADGPTQSISSPYTSSAGSPTPSYFPLITATPSASASNLAGITSTTSNGSQVYTGLAPEIRAGVSLSIQLTIAALFFVSRFYSS